MANCVINAAISMMGLSGSLLATFTTTAVKNSRKNEFWFSLKLYRVYLASLSVSGQFFGGTGF